MFVPETNSEFSEFFYESVYSFLEELINISKKWYYFLY